MSVRTARRPMVVAAIALTLTGIGAWAWNSLTWDVVFSSASPNGLARVWRHSLPIPPDGRYLFYLELVSSPSCRRVDAESTLKPGGSVAKPWLRVSDEPGTWQYLGYLQGMDDLAARSPDRVDWVPGGLDVLSRNGVVGRFRFE